MVNAVFQSVMTRNVRVEDDLLLAALKGLGVDLPDNVVKSIGEDNRKSLKELLKGFGRIQPIDKGLKTDQILPI